MDKIGHVTARRYRALVEQAGHDVEELTSRQFALGDMALGIEPLHARPGGNEGVYATLQAFADDIGVEFRTLLNYRAVAAAWPKRRRVTKASWTVYQRLAHAPRRFEIIKDPPFNDRLGEHRWTVGAAERAAGRASRTATSSPEETVAHIRDLARDDSVAAAAATEFLRRPEVAHRAMADPGTRTALYRAQRDRDDQAHAALQERNPALQRIEHSLQFLELTGYCHSYVAGIKKAVQHLHDNPLSGEERAVAHHLLEQVQAATEFCRSVIDTGELSMDEQLARLLDEEEPP
ncbi:hypothetical protein DI005_20710 [Prauserella sp. PE36]|nr:hypothetical protein DI005_20710 [Prauserella sp. PE36]